MNETINQSLFNATNSTIVEFAADYTALLPTLIQQGDLAATIVGLILFFVLLVLVNKLSGVLLAIIKKTIVFVIVFLVLYHYIPVFIDKVAVEGWTIQNILIGFSGSAICVLALALASMALFKRTKSAITQKPETNVQSQRSIRNILLYMIVAQFGVFSSVTLAAPTVGVGVTILVVFIVGSLLFVRQVYPDYKQGLTHLGIAVGAAFILSLVLGVFWGNQELTKLLSITYFESDSLVAFVTSIAVSLFAGKN